MMSQPGKQTYCPIPQERQFQAMIFGQLTEYIMRHIFLEKSYTKCGG